MGKILLYWRHGKMKIRIGFVTNSSSSSYICQICGEQEESWDTPDWITYCDNGHTFCTNHLEIDSDHKAETEEDYEDKEYCPICAFKAYAEGEMALYLQKTRGISREEVFAEIKRANKRRRVLYDSEYITYVCSKLNLSEEILLQELKERFKNWHEYISFIRGDKTCYEIRREYEG
jgi:hypothetical protein